MGANAATSAAELFNSCGEPFKALVSERGGKSSEACLGAPYGFLLDVG